MNISSLNERQIMIQRPEKKRPCLTDESGIVLVTALLVTALITAVMGGMFVAINADQLARGVDRDQTQAYAAAHAGLEKLTADLVSLFVTDVSPTVAEVEELTAFPPELPGFNFIAPDGSSGYDINYTVDANGNPAVLQNADITAGPYQGFKGLITPYSVVITARSDGGSEVRLRRDLQTVAVPVFQFGVFSEPDLTFYAGDNFDFGGRVHTNGNLYLSELNGFTLKFTDRITALGHVVRTHLSNGKSVSSVAFTGQVLVPTTIGTPGVYRNLKYTGPNEGSTTGFPGATPPPSPNSNWTSISVGTYKNNIRTGTTGAKRLDLPIVSQGATPIDLIRRPGSEDENVTNPLVFGQRYFNLAGLRILLSDRAEDITDIPGVTPAAPVELDGNWLAAPPVGYTVDANRPPIATSIGPVLGKTISNNNGGTYAAPFAEIRMCTTAGDPQCTGVPAGFRHPPLTLQSTLGTINNVTCTGKTATTFFGCNIPAPGLAANGTVSATLPSGLNVSAATTVAVASGTPRTITLSTAGTPFPTAPFSPGLIWVDGNAVTCEGYDTALAPPRFTNCRGLTAVPGTNRIVSSHAHVNQGVGTIGGFIKIERRDADMNWTDVTMEILNLGFGSPNYDGTVCNDPTPNAVIRLQRLRDNGNAVGQNGGCTYQNSRNPYDWWPHALYDAREGNYREVATNTLMEMGGVMQFAELDIRNLKRWLAGEIGATGAQTVVDNGYIVYFSDRRGNHDWADPNGEIDPETGEYGWEDVVNPASAAGTPNNTLDQGEDVNLDGQLQTYGSTPQALVVPAADGHTAPFTIANARPTTNITAAQARVNRTLLFRRALKLRNGGINGGVNNLPDAGLTVVAENPVYVQGNYNATTSTTAEPNRPAAVLADAVTVLSNNWSDARSFRFPNDRDQRPATTTAYRFAVLAGKNPSFVWPTAGNPQFLFGTDGGVGNFLRLLENWNLSGVSINYRGSMVSLYFSRQATGTFKFSTNVYSYGDRNFEFDTDFLQPALLPPGTPMFRDVNTLTFRQILRPNQ
jgi:hypothetical protein